MPTPRLLQLTWILASASLIAIPALAADTTYIGKHLVLKVTPNSAQVTVDGEDRGEAGKRLRLELVPGPHQLTIEHPDYLPMELAFYCMTPEEYRTRTVEGQTIEPSITWFGDIYSASISLGSTGEKRMVLQSSHRQGGAVGEREASEVYLVSGVDRDQIFDAALASAADIRMKTTTINRKSGRVVASKMVPFRKVHLEVDLAEKEEGVLLTVKFRFPTFAVGATDKAMGLYLDGLRTRCGL